MKSFKTTAAVATPSQNISIILALFVISIHGLHCHRKHDHSSDILLQSDTSSHLSPHDKFLHGNGGVLAKSTSPDLFHSAKLVQQQQQPQEEFREERMEAKRDVLVNHQYPSQDMSTTSSIFCPNLSDCTCNFTSNISPRLQVTCTGHFHTKFPVEDLRRDVEVLIIEPHNPCSRSNSAQDSFCGQENDLVMGPTYQLLRQLKVLRIRHSRIPNIGRKTLWGLSGLEILDLSHNALQDITEPNFDSLHSLRELYLNDNQIKSIVSAVFRHALKLQILSLANNKLEGLAPRVFYPLYELKMLDLSGNRIQFIDGAVFVDIPDIEVFKCNDCQLFQLRTPDLITPVKLHTISLAYNDIRDLGDIHPNLLAKIQHLDLTGNQIREIFYRKHLGRSNVLKSLELSSNNISFIEDCAFCNTSLQTLNLAHNSMRSVNPDIFLHDIKSLTKLVLSGNWLTVENIEILVSKIPNLEVLDLDKTQLTSLPHGIFYNNPKLKYLNVSGNFLATLDPSTISGLEYLEVLDLSHNYFHGIDQVVFDVLKKRPRFKMMYLQENPFVCDKCKIGPLKAWLNHTMQYWGACFKQSNSMCLKCHEPDDFMHMPIEHVREDSMPDCLESKLAHNNFPPGRNVEWEMMNSEKLQQAISPYILGGLVAFLILILMTLLMLRYRHYGVYLTHEEDQLVDGEDVLRNPVVVLDKNSESYINLRYPIHSKEDSELTRGLTPLKK